MLAEVGLVGLVAFSAVVIPASAPRVVAGPPACTDTDVDWLCDTAEVPYGDTDGDSLPNWNDPDDDGDGIPTILEHADPSDEGDPRDARDRDRDGQPDWLDAPTLPTDGWVTVEQKISDTAGGFAGILNGSDAFHVATAIGDVDGDGVVDLAVGAPGDDDGQANAGAVYVLFLNVNGTVRAEQKISDTDGGLVTVLDAGDEFGFAVAGLGDLDGDGIGELVAGVRSDDDGGSGRGAVFVLFLNANGTVRAEQKISDTAGGLAATLSNGGEFGAGVTGVGDVDADGLPDLAVGARLGDDGGLDRGEVHVLFLNANGTVRAEQKISDTTGGLAGTLDDGANFGHGLAGPGDIDGDGVEDLVVGAPLGDGGGTDRGEVHVLLLNTNGTVRVDQEISATAGGLGGLLRDGDRFGSSVAGLGDLDGDGVADLAIGAAGDDDHGIDKGAVHLVTLTSSGTVAERWTLSEVDGNFAGALDDADGFGGAVTGLGDIDGDGDLDLAVGAAGDDDGGIDRGAVYVIDLTRAVDTDGDGLYDHRELLFGDTDGDSLPNWNDPDDDGDGIPTSLERADPDGDGDPRDARDSDRDGQPDHLDVPTTASDGTVASEQKISDLAGGFATALTNTDQFGAEVTAIGDLDGDGIVDLAVGANLDNGGGFDRGALYVLFMNADGTVRAEQEISDVQGGLTEVIDDGDYFGRSIAGLGDLDGDGIPDLAVGAPFDDDGGPDRGAVHVLFMNSNGTVRDEEKISDIDGDLAAVLDDLDLFGLAVEGIGDLDGDGFPDLAVGVRNDDDGGADRGAVHVLFMNPDGAVRAEQKISDTQGGLAATLDNSDWFGVAVAALGDLDGDGIGDLAVGARNDDDGGPDTGAAYVLFMNTDGTVRAQQKISDTVGALPPMLALDDGDWFGSGLAGLGDLDGDGRPDLAVGAWRNDDGGTDRGALHVLFLNNDGTVRDESVISDTQGGLAAALDDGDQFGGSVTGLGDLDGDGTIGIAVGAFLDDDGGADRGAVYVLDLQPPAPVIVNSTGDAGDATPGDGVCWTGANNSEANPACTLRAAIQEADAGVADTIHFDIPPTEPGYNGGTGVWTIAVSTSLPMITSPVEIAGATQTVNRGDTNSGTLGLSRAVGTGPDGVVGSGDELTVDGVAAPEIEVDFDASGFRIESSGVEISGLAMFGGNADVWIQSGTGAVVADNVIGTRASSFSDPGPAARSTGTGGVAVAGGSDVSIVGNLIGFQSERGINVFGNAVDVVISGNEIRSTGMDGTDQGGGIELTNFYVVGTALSGVTITGNLITGSVADFGVEVATDAGDSGIVIRDNTVLGNSVLLYGDQNPDGGMVRHNEIRNADLDGVLVDGVSGWSILGNSITDSATLGIALFSGANDALGAPTIDAALSDGPTIDVDVTVVAPAGTYRVEFFTNTVADPSGFGEGERFVGSTTITHAGGSGAYSATIASTRRGFLSATLTVDEGSGAFGSTSAFSNSRTVACTDADADGLCNVEEDANSDADGDPTTNPGPDTDGDSLSNHLDADDDGDGIATSLENADPNGDGDPRDARDRDRDGQPDWLDTEAGPSSTPVASEQKISAVSGGLVGPLDDGDELGQDVTGIGDLDGDGIDDLAVGVPLDDDGGTNRGAVYVLFMNADGTVRDEQKISDTAGGFTGALVDFGEFGHGVATLGDLDGDGVTDIAVGTWNDSDGGPSRGAVWILFLERDGTVKAHQKISDTTGGLLATLDDFDRFGSSSSGLGDLDGDGTPDVIVGAREDDDGGINRGAAYVLFLNPDGTVRAEQKISDITGGLTGVLDDFDEFGHDVAGISDLDGDGIDDAAVGSFGDDDGGPNRGAAYVLFLNADGTVRAEQKLSAAAGPLAAALGDEDRFGNALVGIGDIDGNGTPDLAVAASEDDDGALDAGAVHLLRLATDGTIIAADKISATTGGLTGPLDAFDHFGRGIGSLGDLDGDGTLNLAISARYDDDGGPNRGAIYILDLQQPAPVIVNATGDATDAAIGDGACWTGATNSEGDPECTLRAAIEEADAGVTMAIHFAVPTSDPGHSGGVWTIAPATSLPAIDARVVLDATTQTGWTVTPVVELDGSSAGAAVDGITLAAGSGGSEIRGLAIGGFSREGLAVELGSDGNLIAGNHLGTDASGTVDAGNASSGIYVQSDGNTIGGATAADRNVISGNDGYGIYLGWSSNNTIVGNRIGVDVTGNAPLGNTWNGVLVAGIGHVIGGSTPGARNVFGDHGDIAVRIESGSGHRVVGNSIGVGADGTTALGNAFGVSVRFGATDVVIGGTAPGDGNIIRHNGKAVLVQDGATDDIAVLGNEISANGGLGIDLGDDGVTAGDAGDADIGPNALLNFPVITAADAAAGMVDLEVQLDVPAGSYRLEVFDNPSGADPSGHGEGEQYVHAFTVTHVGGGPQTFTASFPGAAGDLLTATTTEDLGGGVYGSTSEFSAAVTVCGDTDGDGLCDAFEDLFGDTDGDLLVNRLDADDDGDGIPTASENADPNGDGDPRDSLDSDHDGQPDWLDRPAAPTSGVAVDEQKISSTQGGLVGPLANADLFGAATTSIGDLDGDGVVDIAVGAYNDADGGPARGGVHVLFLNPDGSVRDEQTISSIAGGLLPLSLDDSDYFGWSVAGIGDVDGDGIPDIAVGAIRDDDGGPDRGALYVLFMNADGTVRAQQKISSTAGGLAALTLDDDDAFGGSVTGMGDLDGDGLVDLAVGAFYDSDGGSRRGAVHVLFLNADGTVKAQQKISSTTGGLVGPLDNTDYFGNSIATLGDVDGDGVTDLAVGAYFDGDGGSTRGAVYVLFMNADGTVRDEQKISSTSGGLTGPLDNGDWFGFSVAGPGDLDGDGNPDLAVGATFDDDGGLDRGAVYVLYLHGDGTVREETKMSSTVGGINAPIDDGDYFGGSLAPLGDLDGDGTVGLAVGAYQDDDGGLARGAVYILDLEPIQTVVNSTGDASDATSGTGVCDTGGAPVNGAPECSLRAALESANAQGGGEIVFDIPVTDPNHAAGVWTVSPASMLPEITSPVTLDGTSQPGFASTPVIELDGSAAGSAGFLGTDGLRFNGSVGPSMVRALAIGDFADNAIHLEASANLQIVGNHLGVDAPGTAAMPLGSDTVSIGGSSDVVIGGASPADRNIISSGNRGVIVHTASSNVIVVGNYIGTDVTGMVDLGNSGGGVEVRGGSTDTVIGGPTAAHGNLISGNGGVAVWVHDETTDRVTIQHNNIGFAADETTSLGIGNDGIFVWDGPDDVHTLDNLIGAAPTVGVEYDGASSGGVIQRNIIGTDRTLAQVLSYGESAVRIDRGATVLVGGADPNDGNVITGAGSSACSSGVDVMRAGTTASILGNRIFGNAGLGIDLGVPNSCDGVTANDPGDADTGGNGGLNHPDITSAFDVGPDLAVGYTVDTAAGTYRVEFFANPGGGDEAEEVRFGETIVHPGGAASYSTSVPGARGDRITATLTQDLGSSFGATSELSSVFVVPANSAPVLDNSGTTTFTTITEDDTTNLGNTVAELIASAGGDRITDVDGDPEGIAIVGFDVSGNTGPFEYSLDGGATWTVLTWPIEDLLLGSTDRIRLVPAGYRGTSSAWIDFRAWDATSGARGDTVTISSTGGSTAFSSAIERATITTLSVNDAPTFGVPTEGITAFDLDGTDDSFSSVVELPGGKVLAVGSVGSFASADILAVRFLASGEVDTTFGTMGVVRLDIATERDGANQVIVDASGRYVIAGRATIAGMNDAVVVRLNPDGSLDTTFSGDGIFTSGVAGPAAAGLVLQSDGALVYVTSTTAVRLLPNGTLDAGFDGDGTATFGGLTAATSIGVQSSGRIIIGGSVGGQLGAVALTSAGAVDTGFATAGYATVGFGDALWSWAAGLTVMADDRIVLTGTRYEADGDTTPMIAARLTAGGALDTTFAGTGYVKAVGTPPGFYGSYSGVAVQPDGAVVIAGYLDFGWKGQDDLSIARYTSAGVLDTSFAGTGHTSTGSGRYWNRLADVIVLSDGDLLAVGQAEYDGPFDAVMVRYDTDGSLHTGLATSQLDGTPVHQQGLTPVTLDPDVRVFDRDLIDLSDMGGTSLTIVRSGGTNPGDEFVASGALSPLVAAGPLVYGGVTIGTVTANSGGTLRLDFDASATEARVNDAFASIAYQNAIEPIGTTVTLAWTFGDGNSGAQGSGGEGFASGSVPVEIVAPRVIVNSTSDAGDATPGDGLCDTGGWNSLGEPECTLRAAIEEANASAPIASIEFDLPITEPGHTAGTWTITVPASFDPITSTSLDARTQPGWSGTPVVVIDVDGNGGPGLVLNGTGSSVSGVSVVNGLDGVSLGGAGGHTLRDSWIGISADGVTDGGHTGSGVVVDSPDNVIDHVVSSGNDANGVLLATGSDRTRVTGSRFGTNGAGTAPVPNGYTGVAVFGAVDAIVGGTNPGEGNLLAGNGLAGVSVENGSVDTTIQGNTIGAPGMPNGFNGVLLDDGTGTMVGGIPAASANVVTNSGFAGVLVTAGTHSVIGNSISGNTGIGIDVGGGGVLANDPGDGDSGPNELLNTPIIVRAAESSGSVAVDLELDAPAGNYRIEVFANPGGGDPSGYGEGQVFLGSTSITHPGGGPVSMSLVVNGAAGDVLSATATRILGAVFGATSEFSAVATVQVGGDVVYDSGRRRTDMTAFGGADVVTPGSGIAATGIDLQGGAERLMGPATDIDAGLLSLSGWVRLDASGSDPRVIAKRTGAGGSIYELLVDDATGEAVARLAIGGSVVEVRGGSVPVGSWHQLDATWDGVNVALYVDGIAVDSAGTSGALATDLTTPLTIGNTADAAHGLDGSVDHIVVSHIARPAPWIATTFANLSDPARFVSIGTVQTDIPGAWTTTTSVTRTGSHALDAPLATSGTTAWTTLRGIDEPGLVLESWWYLTDLSTTEAAAGTNTGQVATDQHEATQRPGGVDLATVGGPSRSVDGSAASPIAAGAWTKVEIRTDETGTSSMWVDGVQVIAPTLQPAGPNRGSGGFRVGGLSVGQHWYIDDVRARRYVSDEPATSLGAIERA